MRCGLWIERITIAFEKRGEHPLKDKERRGRSSFDQWHVSKLEIRTTRRVSTILARVLLPNSIASISRRASRSRGFGFHVLLAVEETNNCPFSPFQIYSTGRSRLFFFFQISLASFSSLKFPYREMQYGKYSPLPSLRLLKRGGKKARGRVRGIVSPSPFPLKS